MAFFGVMLKSPEPASVSGALSVKGPTPSPSVSPRGERNVRAGERLVARVKFAVVGGSAAASGSAGCGR